RQSQRGKKLAAFGAELPRLAGVIDRVAGRQNFARSAFEHLESVIQLGGHAGEFDGVELLEAVERARHGAVANRGDRAESYKLVAGTGHVDVLQLIRVEPPGARDLRDYFVR